MKNKMMKIISAILTSVLLLNSYFCIIANASSKSQLEAQKSKIESEIKENQKKINAMKGDISKQAEYVNALYDNIDSLQKYIDVYTNKIDAQNAEIKKTNDKIESINKKIAKTEKEISDNKDKMKKTQDEIVEIKKALAKRLRATYIAGNASTLELLLSAEDMSSYLTTAEMLKRIADNDDKIVKSLVAKIQECLKLEEELKKQTEALNADKKSLNEEKAVLEEKVNELEEEQKVYTDKQNEISLKYAEANEALSKLNKESAAYKNQISRLQTQEAQIESQIQAIITGGNAGVNYSPSSNPSGYINPVPYSDAYISSPYGMRTNPVTGVYKLHSGIDISCGGAGGQTGPFTKSIVAAKAGTVSYVGWVSGYGNTVMITHPDGYLTLYGHNYAFKVSVGQKVKQGQQIAIMGSTGNSTGAHCHFEIRNGMWGTTMNPAPYI